MGQQNDLSIGIDIGGTNTKFGIVDRSGNILEKGSVCTTDHSDPENLLSLIHDQLYNNNSLPITGIGIGAPNGNFFRGTIEHAPNLQWKGIIPLRSIAEKIFSVPSFVTNDANAAAIGEMTFGNARGMKDFIMLTLGTGVGSGIVANGRLILGNGFAGELGHVTVFPGGRLHPSTGLRGSLEMYASAQGIVESAIMFLSGNNAGILKPFPKEELTPKIIFDAALKGDPVAMQTFNYTAEVLGLALANFVMFSAPEAIILFGGIMRTGENFINKIKDEMDKNLLPVFKGQVRILGSSLPESDAAILGASSLVWANK